MIRDKSEENLKREPLKAPSEDSPAGHSEEINNKGIIDRLDAIEKSLEEIKRLLLQLIEPDLEIQMRLKEIARQFSMGNKGPLKQWNREHSRKEMKKI